MTQINKDPMGSAIADYYEHGNTCTERLRVFSPMFEEDEIPLPTLFRSWEEMTPLEQKALGEARGRVLDVGAGAGCHSLVLQSRGLNVTAIDISALSVETMKKRGVRNALVQDFWDVTERYDTILMLMNGIGIVGTMDRLPDFFRHIGTILADGGKVIVESTDISYVFEDEEGFIEYPNTTEYFGEITYQMKYKDVEGDTFPWLYIEFEKLAEIAQLHGFTATMLQYNENDNFIAEITPCVPNI